MAHFYSKLRKPKRLLLLGGSTYKHTYILHPTNHHQMPATAGGGPADPVCLHAGVPGLPQLPHAGGCGHREGEGQAGAQDCTAGRTGLRHCADIAGGLSAVEIGNGKNFHI